MKRSLVSCVLYVVSLVPAVMFAQSAPQTLVVSSVYADSSVIAPVAWYRHDDGQGRSHRIGLSGWTIEAESLRKRSERISLLFSADATPMNAHNSNRTFEYGERTEHLDYEHASYRARGGVRIRLNEDSHFDVLAVGLYESVSDLPQFVLARWDRPYAGIEVAHTYRAVREEQPLIAQIDGLELTTRAEAFTGEDDWTRVTFEQNWGNTIGRVHLRQGSSAVFGDGLDWVNSPLIGGSWDALGGRAVYGLRHGEIRDTAALSGNFGADVRIGSAFWIGGRASALIGEDLIHGFALNVSGTWRTFGFNGGIARAEAWGDRDTSPEVYAAVIVPLHRK